MGAQQRVEVAASTGAAMSVPSLSVCTEDTLIANNIVSDYSMASETVLRVPMHGAVLPSAFASHTAAVPQPPAPPPNTDLMFIDQFWEEWGLGELESPGDLPPVVQLPDA